MAVLFQGPQNIIANKCYFHIVHTIPLSWGSVIASNDVNTLQSALANVVIRIDKCIESGGGHVDS